MYSGCLLYESHNNQETFKSKARYTMQMVLTVALYANTQYFRLTRMGATQLIKALHKTHPVREGSIPKNSYHVIGGRIAMTTISLVVFRGIEPRP